MRRSRPGEGNSLARSLAMAGMNRREEERNAGGSAALPMRISNVQALKARTASAAKPTGEGAAMPPRRPAEPPPPAGLGIADPYPTAGLGITGGGRSCRPASSACTTAGAQLPLPLPSLCGAASCSASTSAREAKYSTSLACPLYQVQQTYVPPGEQAHGPVRDRFSAEVDWTECQCMAA
eukprot:SAG11_NODE_2290_length_3558_cov_2.262215_4_plen_180_part_00